MKGHYFTKLVTEQRRLGGTSWPRKDNSVVRSVAPEFFEFCAFQHPKILLQIFFRFIKRALRPKRGSVAPKFHEEFTFKAFITYVILFFPTHLELREDYMHIISHNAA